MRRIAALALSMSSIFLAIVAVLINSPALFYMATALIATLLLARLQAVWSVRSLRFERYAPPMAQLGQKVKIEVVVWSERRVRRPLVVLRDVLPARLHATGVGPSLPVAPDFSRPVRSAYTFVARRRGVFRWQQVIVSGTDAMGLVTMQQAFGTTPVEMTVVPVPIPFTLDLPSGGGWGISEMTSGQNRGAGVEPYGIREYRSGDSLRHVHWASTARRGQLLVKEFEAGSQGRVRLFLPPDHDSDVDPVNPPADGVLMSTLDMMCGHALYLTESFVRQGADVSFPQWETASGSSYGDERLGEVGLALAKWQPTAGKTYATELEAARDRLEPGMLVIAFLSLGDGAVAQALGRLRSAGASVTALLYDPKLWNPSTSVSPATDPGYIELLRSKGVHTRLMEASPNG